MKLAYIAINRSIGLAEEAIDYSLPREFVHGLLWSGFKGELHRPEEIIALLKDGPRFPNLVDIVIRGVNSDESQTLLLWIPHEEASSSYLEKEWNDGQGPFRSGGIMSGRAHGNPPKQVLKRQYRDWLEGRS